LNAIAQMLRNIGGEVFDYQVLLDVLAEYRKPRDRITRLLGGGVIVRVKKGLYCFGEPFRREPLSREYLANLIYGPSYVSLEYALSHHGLIPERVETVTSVTTRRSRDFDTPFGTFSYRMLTGPRYAVGAILETVGKTSFLVASPEKALADKVWTDKRFSGLRLSDYDAYLSDDLRIDREALSRFDCSRLQVIATAYHSAKISNLVRYLKRFKEAPHA
jgi:predicted transcriptional regulator of viral defense system